MGDDNERRQALLTNVGLLRDELRPILSPALEDQFHDLRGQIGLTDQRVHVQQRLELDQAYSLLMQRGEHFSNSLDFEGLTAGLERSLPELGMLTTSVFLYGPGNRRQLQPLVSLVDGTTLLMAAASGSRLKTFTYAYEIDPHVAVVTSNGNTPMHVAVAMNNRTQPEVCEVIQFLADHGALLDEFNAAKRTPISIADNLPVDLAVDLLTRLITESG